MNVYYILTLAAESQTNDVPCGMQCGTKILHVFI
jgi:hypothetical protein